jgi:hypothetical protein
MGSKVLKG